MITEESWNEWKHHPITKAVFKALYNEREKLKEMLADGGIPTEDVEKVAGRCQAVKGILLMTYDDLTDSLKESYGS